MTYYSYKTRTLRQRQINRQYRHLIFVLVGIIMVLIVLLFTSQNSVAQADEMVIETYRSEVIEPGETLWSLAEEYRLPDMPIEEYIKEVVSNLKNVTLISGYDLVPEEEAYFADLRLHPNDNGFKKQSERLYEKIEKYL